MRLPRWFTPERRRSLIGGVAGMGAAAGVVLVLLVGLPVPSRQGALAWALLAPGSTVFVLSLAVAFGRLASGAIDPLSDRAGRYLAVTQRALTNSVEQALVFAAAGAAAAMLADAGARAFVPALAIAFLLSRLAFWIGYLRDPFARAPGMAATFAVNAAALACALVAVV